MGVEQDFEARVSSALMKTAALAEARVAQLVDISSYSQDHAGVDRVAQVLAQWGEEIGLSARLERSGDSALHCILETSGVQGPRILLIGHSDTVFPKGHEAGDFRIDPADPARFLGPGITDMKGGNVVILTALEALASLDLLDQMALTCFFSADEEIGSPSGRTLLEPLARKSDLALVFETGSLCGDDATSIVIQRKGMLRARLVIEGVESHAGAKKEEGLSAILVGARLVEGLEALNDPHRGCTVNVGVFQGGSAANTVPGSAELSIDARFESPGEGDRIMTAISELVAATHLSDAERGTATQTQVLDVLRHDPLTPNDRSRSAAQAWIACGRTLGQNLVLESRGGASDGNIASSIGCPTLDGLGTVGGRIHSAGEWAIRSSLIERAQLLALNLIRRNALVESPS